MATGPKPLIYVPHSADYRESINNTRRTGSQQPQYGQENEVDALHYENENGIDTNAAAEAITVSWQPAGGDRTGLTRHIIRQLSKGFLTKQVFVFIGSFGVAHLLHRMPLLRTLPQIWCVVGWWVMLICIYAFGSWRLIRNSTALQSHLNAITVNGDQVTLKYTDRERSTYPIQYVTSLSHEADGIYFELAENWMRIPLRAFGEEGSASFENVFIHNTETAHTIQIPQPPNSAQFPFAITFQQSDADVSHACKNGWSRPLDRSGWLVPGLLILFGPMLFTFVMALLTGSSLDTATVAIPAGLVISGVIGIPTVLFAAGTGSQIAMARQRHSFEQPLLVALGPSGVEIRDGRSAKVIAWNIVRKLSGDERLIYIDMPDDLILIPRSVFLDNQQAGEFLDAAKAYKQGKTPRFNSMRAVWPPPPGAIENH